MQVRSRKAWVLTGVALDGVTLAIVWLSLHVVPLDELLAWWLQVLGLAACAWLIHVIVLGAGRNSLGGAVTWSLRTVAFVLSVGLFGPATAVLTVMNLGSVLRIPAAAAERLLPGVAWRWAADTLSEPGFWCIVAAMVGGVIGLLMAVARRLDRSVDDPRAPPRILSDVVGGGSGGALAMGLLFAVAGAGGLSWRNEMAAPLLDLILRAPLRPGMIAIGVVALLPHLLLARPRQAGTPRVPGVA